MTTPRRRIVRPSVAVTPADPVRQRRLHRLRARLEKEQAALARWTVRLKRSFNAMVKAQQCVTRVQHQIARLED